MPPRPPSPHQPSPASPIREVGVTGIQLGFPELTRVIVTTDFHSSRVGWHQHPFWEVLLFFRGGASYEFADGQRKLLRGDQFLVIPPETQHRGAQDIRLPSELLSIGLRNSPSPKARPHSPLSSPERDRLFSGLRSVTTGIFELRGPAWEDASRLRRWILERAQQTATTLDSRIRHLSALLLMGLTECMAGGETGSLSQPIAAALDFLNASLAHPVGMDAVAETVGLSRKRFYLQFRREMGMTPNDCLQRLRLRCAEKLLAASDLTVEAVGTESGFTRATYFCRVFRNYFGRTPGQYRLEMRGSSPT